MTEREKEERKRLRREMLLHRSLRNKSRSLVQERASTRSVHRAPDRVHNGRIVRGAVVLEESYGGTLFGFVVRVKPLTNNNRKAFLHFAEKHGLKLIPCEHNLIPAKGRTEAEMSQDALCTAYIVTGDAESCVHWDKVKNHKFTLDVHAIGSAANRMKNVKRDPLDPGPMYKKPTSKPRPKHQRDASTALTVSGCAYEWVEESLGFGRVKMVKRLVAQWEQRQVRQTGF